MFGKFSQIMFIDLSINVEKYDYNTIDIKTSD
jgi:hypothetical protein